MIFRGIARCRQYRKLLSFGNRSETTSGISHLKSSIPIELPCQTAISFRRFSLSTHLKPQEFTEPIRSENDAEEKKKPKKKPLSIYFKEAVGLLEKSPEDIETQEGGEDENAELKTRLGKLEEELRSLRGNSKITERRKEQEEAKRDEGLSKKSSLSSLFVDKAGIHQEKILKEKRVLEMEDSDAYKRLTPDMVKFVTHLYKNGYFNDSNFLPRNRFKVSCFENRYARDFVKFAAEQFGKDNQEIAKWLSGSELKKVARFGCPSLAKKTVFSAKSLRRFFRIQENTVCDKCVLKQSCKFVNQSVWKGNDNNLDLAVVMRVITPYALESVSPQLVVPEDITDSVSRLLNEAVNLSESVATRILPDSTPASQRS